MEKFKKKKKLERHQKILNCQRYAGLFLHWMVHSPMKKWLYSIAFHEHKKSNKIQEQDKQE